MPNALAYFRIVFITAPESFKTLDLNDKIKRKPPCSSFLHLLWGLDFQLGENINSCSILFLNSRLVRFTKVDNLMLNLHAVASRVENVEQIGANVIKLFTAVSYEFL